MASTTSRTDTNRFFQAWGEKYVTDHTDEIPGAERLLKGRGCLEQLGRMIDTAEAATVLDAAKNAADALTAGGTVKQVETYLRQGRTTGEWSESLLTATKVSALAKPIKGLIPADLIVIKCMLEAFANDNDTMAKVLEEEGRIKPGEWYDPYYAMKRSANMARMYVDKVKAAFEVTTGEKYPKTQFNPRFDEEPTL